MLDYERQWTEASGHQARHPLRVKMQALEALMSEAGDPLSFTRLLIEGRTCGDPFRELLCDELLPRWQQLAP